MHTSELAQALEQLSGLPHCLQDEGCETELPPRRAGGKGTGPRAQLLWRYKGHHLGERSTMPMTPHSSAYLGFWGCFFWLFAVFLFLSFLYFFFPLSMCALACIHNSSSSFSLSASPFPLTSAPFCLLPFTGSCPASITEKSMENIHLCPDFTTCQLEGAWRILFSFNSDAA